MIEKLDNIHYSFRNIDGYNKPFNIIISSRDAGKTTTLWVKKVYDNWKKNHKPWLYLVRNANEIVEPLLDDIILPINKFRDEDAKFIFQRGALESGILDVFMKDGDKEYLFISSPFKYFSALFGSMIYSSIQTPAIFLIFESLILLSLQERAKILINRYSLSPSFIKTSRIPDSNAPL